VIQNENVRLFASLCRELHDMGGGQTIMLHQVSLARLFGCSWRTIGNWIKALKTIGVLKLAEPARRNARAARYFYLKANLSIERSAREQAEIIQGGPCTGGHSSVSESDFP